MTESVTGAGIAQSHHCNDIAGIDLFDFLSFVGVHLHQTANLFPNILGCIQNLDTTLELSRVNTQKG